MNHHTGVEEKIIQNLNDVPFDAVLLIGWDNVAYACGVSLPFAPYRYAEKIACLLSRSGESYLICPHEITSTVKNLGYTGFIAGYRLNGDDEQELLSTVSEILARVGNQSGVIGIDLNRMSMGFYQKLQVSQPGSSFEDASQWLINLRKIKTGKESALLSEAAFKTDHGINGHFHHIMGARPVALMGLAENIRVHCMERFLDEVGYNKVSRVLDCEPSMRLYPYCENHGFNYGYSPTHKTQTGQMYSVSMTASLKGYCSDASRILSYGEPDEGQQRDYEKINKMRAFLLENLKPGIICGDLARKAEKFAEDNHIDILPGIAFGHGIGVTTQEAPYLTQDNREVLESGMVLVLDQVVVGSHKQVYRSKDTVVITPTGNELVNWWKDWREPYQPIPYL